MTVFMGKFFPYYFDRLSHKRNDMLGIAVMISGIGALLVFSGCLLFEPLVIRKFSERSKLLVQFYYWSLLFAFFYLCFMILESYLYTLKRTVLPNFMKETAYRICVSVLIALYAFQVIDFDLFVKLFCSVYLLIVIAVIIYLVSSGQLYLNFRFSTVTKRLRRQIFNYVSFVYSGIVINGIARQIDTLALAGVTGLTMTGVYTLNQYTAAVIQVPYRALLSIAGPMIAMHWKNKNHHDISRIYKRASINLQLISSFLFLFIWINYDDGLHLLGLDPSFAEGKMVFLILGIFNVIDLTLGISSSVIMTSPAWRFEFYSGLILLATSIPLNIYLARSMGMIGVALATLSTYTVYNTLRLVFIKLRFGYFPFSINSLYALLLAIGAYAVTLLISLNGLAGMVVKSAIFSVVYLGGVWLFKLTPDLAEVMRTVSKRLGRK
jgi:O-antigen/teichoic acid export membrane protein